METERRWEDLPMDCLVHIFDRLGLEDKSLGVPFVCNSWYIASLNPLCWKVLDFRPLDFELDSPFIRRFQQEYRITSFSFTGFLKFAVNHSRRSANMILFPEKGFERIESDGCPALKVFRWRCPSEEVMKHFAKYIHKWKDLEQLFMKISPSSFTEVIMEISCHCKNFKVFGTSSYITELAAKAIVTFLPKIKYLDLSHSFMSKEILLIILDGCKDLEEFYVKNCIAFEADDEILRKASHLKVFEYEGSEIRVDQFNRLFVQVREQIIMILSNYLPDDSSDED
ncbi:F-box/LRR-repeat protein At3g48880-like isoform X2 [Magnolia sinica]|uniref:F-box/LRR-repeat protein At3g48880-like isoform X2 n=1 Tax=Magnolia sinica TaxID=86752 RepID=UPI00265A4C44|nr:F-box/LRR-repeat protein At3g48880-like isoform X2 [Magnolia sinica]